MYKPISGGYVSLRSLVLFLCLMVGLFSLLTVDSAEGHGKLAGRLRTSLIAKWTDCVYPSTTKVTRKYKTRQLYRTPSYGGGPGAKALPPSLHEHTREFFEREYVKRGHPDYKTRCDSYKLDCPDPEVWSVIYLGNCDDDAEDATECHEDLSSTADSTYTLGSITSYFSVSYYYPPCDRVLIS